MPVAEVAQRVPLVPPDLATLVVVGPAVRRDFRVPFPFRLPVLPLRQVVCFGLLQMPLQLFGRMLVDENVVVRFFLLLRGPPMVAVFCALVVPKGLLSF